MSHYWENLAARSNGQHTTEEFAAAAYRLVAEQVLYYTDRSSRSAYWIVERYEREISQVVAPLGVTIKVNRQLRYAYAVPHHEKCGSASVAQTKFALVLRAIYDESARLGQLTDEGEVVCDLIGLEENYRLMTGHSFPTKGELDSLIRAMKRWGLAKKSDEDFDFGGDYDSSQPYVVIIRPAIIDLLGEAALERLAQWNPDNGSEEIIEEGTLDLSDEGEVKL